MVRFLERNGYNASYSTDIDSDRRGAEILEHKAFLSVGHDEYWSGNQRANVEAARAAGVHLAFFSGNEVFWKTRLEPSIDGTGTPNRTLVTYKETHANAKIDPTPGRLDRHLARPALQPAGRRRPPGERADGADLRGQRRRHERDQGPGRRRQDALLAQHADRHAGGRRDHHAADRHARLRVGLRPRQRRRARPGHSSSRRRRSTGAPVLQDYGVDVRQRHGHPQHDDVQGGERRARVRRRDRPVVVGARRQPRPRQRRGQHEHAAGHGQPARRHGLPAGHADDGPDGRHPERPTPPRRARRSPRRPANAQIAAGYAGHHVRHRHRHGGGVVGGVEVSTDGGTSWHRGDRARHLDLHVGGRRARAPPRSAAARPTTAATSSRRRRASRSRSAPATRAARARSGRAARRRRSPSENDSSRARGGREVPRRRRRQDHRPALLQGLGQHRHARRPPVDAHRHAARHRHLQRRERHRLAAGQLLHAGRDHRQHDLRRLLPRAERPLRGQRGLLRARPASTRRRCTRSRTASTAATASTATGRAAPSRPACTGPRTTGSTSSSTRAQEEAVVVATPRRPPSPRPRRPPARPGSASTRTSPRPSARRWAPRASPRRTSSSRTPAATSCRRP